MWCNIAADDKTVYPLCKSLAVSYKTKQAPTYDTEISLLDIYPKIDEHICPERTCVSLIQENG